MACQIATRMTMLKKGQVCSGATWWFLICLPKCQFRHTVVCTGVRNVLKQCVRLLYTYNLNIEENEVGPDSRQVPHFDLAKLTLPIRDLRAIIG